MQNRIRFLQDALERFEIDRLPLWRAIGDGADEMPDGFCIDLVLN